MSCFTASTRLSGSGTNLRSTCTGQARRLCRSVLQGSSCGSTTTCTRRTRTGCVRPTRWQPIPARPMSLWQLAVGHMGGDVRVWHRQRWRPLQRQQQQQQQLRLHPRLSPLRLARAMAARRRSGMGCMSERCRQGAAQQAVGGNQCITRCGHGTTCGHTRCWTSVHRARILPSEIGEDGWSSPGQLGDWGHWVAADGL
ncbi:hypothetical protein DL89DRAFT_117755 [Linderina pennispora]|uniref:Uncharacterized protein n=1 Tax=Linderina pennispora TaxID=61395 RepID=A0A1Y1VVL1_9FUNG|nr:uncharacterized protein DL89DRAFT_117755 [Linderina pennispora]ORX65337.1 hypothetical protein DL89DRAFT_117755 [Linderina pennispora]